MKAIVVASDLSPEPAWRHTRRCRVRASDVSVAGGRYGRSFELVPDPPNRRSAAAGPYLDIQMSPHLDGPDGHLAYKDAIFLWPHKFIGGPGTPGVLVAKRELFDDGVPTCPVAGRVAFVTTDAQRYLGEPVSYVGGAMAFRSERASAPERVRVSGTLHRAGTGDPSRG